MQEGFGMLKYLYRRKLKSAEYKTMNPGWLDDHEHCIFCGAEFSEREDGLKRGMVTADDVYWICEECYQENREQYEWTLCRE